MADEVLDRAAQEHLLSCFNKWADAEGIGEHPEDREAPLKAFHYAYFMGRMSLKIK